MGVVTCAVGGVQQLCALYQIGCLCWCSVQIKLLVSRPIFQLETQGEGCFDTPTSMQLYTVYYKVCQNDGQ